jgi:hypothetical protein
MAEINAHPNFTQIGTWEAQCRDVDVSVRPAGVTTPIDIAQPAEGMSALNLYSCFSGRRIDLRQRPLSPLQTQVLQLQIRDTAAV